MDDQRDANTTNEEAIPSTPEERGSVDQAPEEFGVPDLDRRLAQPILKGHEGIETAQVWIGAFLIVIAGIVAYSNAFRLPFHPDDRELLLQNEGLEHFTHFNQLVSAFPRQPLAMLSLGLNAWLTPDLPVFFRMKAIGIHIFTGVLIYLLARRLLKRGTPEPVAMLAGLLFALHPLAPEAVNLLLARGTLQAVGFSILSILLFLHATEDEARVRPWLFAGSVLGLVVAWGSETAVVGLPVLVLAADWVVRGGPLTRSRFLAHLGYWGAALLLLAAHMAAFATPPGHVEDPGAPFTVRLAMLYRQLLWIVAPQEVSAAPAVPSLEAAHSQAIVAGATAVVLLVGALLLLWRRSLVGFALLWCVVIQLGWALMARPPFMASGFEAYLPLAGAVLLLPWAFQLVPAVGRLRAVAGVAAAVLLLAAGIGAFNRNQTWRSGIALWSDAVARNPESAQARLRLAEVFLNEGALAMGEAAALASQQQSAEAATRRQAALDQFRSAEEHIRATLDLEPDNPRALFVLGQALEYLARPSEAAEAFRKALALDPRHPEAIWHLALATEAQGTPDDMGAVARAVELYRRADETGRLPAHLLPRYAGLLSTLGAFEESREVLARAAAQFQGPALEAVQEQAKEIDKALQAVNALNQQMSAALQQNPQGGEVLALRGQLQALTGHNLQAAYLLQAALERNPQDGNAWLLLGLARARMGAADRFVQEWPEPPPAQAPATMTWRMLARAAAGAGLWDGARTYLEAAGRAGELAGTSPSIALADLAVEQNQPQRAVQYLVQAAEANPTDPVPWLRLTDIAIALNDIPGARAHFLKARERNAPPEELAKREQKIGEVPVEQGPGILR